MTEDSLHLRVAIDAPPESVFKALTDADDLAEWFAESAEVDLATNQYQFWGRYAPQGDRARQRLTAAEPGRTLRYTWDFDGGASTVDIAIEPGGEGGCVVTLRHDGLPAGLGESTACFWYVSLANLAAFAEGLQTMPPFDFSAPAQGDALVRTVIDVPVEDVYASLLDPAQVDKWAAGKAVIEPEVGGKYEFGWDHGPTTILELEPDRLLAYSWRNEDGSDTVVRWSLRGSRGSTFLTLTHNGFASDELSERYRQGWPGYLVELKRILEQAENWKPLKL